MKFAVVGSGISGLSMALILSQDHEVFLYEIDDRYGGHSNTIDVDYDKKKISVDTGFIVFNKLNYPNLIKLFKFRVDPENILLYTTLLPVWITPISGMSLIFAIAIG